MEACRPTQLLLAVALVTTWRDATVQTNRLIFVLQLNVMTPCANEAWSV